jgi:60 kDa SS-A/Ro ribonucleoprotein
MRLPDAVRAFNKIVIPEGTDCSLPFKHAADNGVYVDAFVAITDNETWAGDRHPVQALNTYRKHYGDKVKMAVMGMVATGGTIGDTADPLTLNVVGFDTATPGVVADFIRE